eukprot:UN07579
MSRVLKIYADFSQKIYSCFGAIIAKIGQIFVKLVLFQNLLKR